MAMWKPPSDQEMADMALEDAAHRATLAHPQTQALKGQILAELQQAAARGSAPGGGGGEPPVIPMKMGDDRSKMTGKKGKK
jgi:hypothetical protein